MQGSSTSPQAKVQHLSQNIYLSLSLSLLGLGTGHSLSLSLSAWMCPKPSRRRKWHMAYYHVGGCRGNLRSFCENSQASERRSEPASERGDGGSRCGQPVEGAVKPKLEPSTTVSHLDIHEVFSQCFQPRSSRPPVPLRLATPSSRKAFTWSG